MTNGEARFDGNRTGRSWALSGGACSWTLAPGRPPGGVPVRHFGVTPVIALADVYDPSLPLESGLDLAAFHDGRAEIMSAVYLKHGGALLRAVRAYAGPAEAESVVHDVFVELLCNRDLRSRFVGGGLFAWLRQIARLKALEHLRRARRDVVQEHPPEGQASPEPDLEARDILTRFMTVAVPPKQREFFGLRFLERHTQIEVAARLGIARSTLEGWEHGLIDKLRTFVLENTT
jgi:RNA polymerase sigma factor (sigma-70 family)